jgi:dCMP deaminase
MRERLGGGVFGLKTRQTIENDSYDQWVIDGIRNPAEIKELSKLNNFYLLGISASSEIIIKRILERNREGDSISREDITAKLDKEKGKNEPEHGQQVEKCLQLVNFLILNESSLEELKRKVYHFLGLIKGTERFTFDEIFMEIAYTWSKRATCLRRQVGAVIAKDTQQLTTGYNGAPRGIPHCAEVGGCLREKMNIPSGQRHEICRGAHAEQNAITQAAKFGIDINNSTLYCNTFPCVICTKMILNSGIKKIVYDSDYDDLLSKQLLSNQNSLEIIRYEGWMSQNNK